MPRPPRVHVDGYPLHIVQRGHNRDRCFFDEYDYERYLGFLIEAAAQCGCALHAYVLRTNHLHLLLTPAEAVKVPKLLVTMGSNYVRYVNRRQDRSGSLWESRYHSSLVDRDE